MELTPEAFAALTKRVEALEKKWAEQTPPGKLDWLSVVGISDDNEFTRQMLAEIEASREAERRAARNEADEAIVIDDPPTAGSKDTP
jgi:hypothetical protein